MSKLSVIHTMISTVRYSTSDDSFDLNNRIITSTKLMNNSKNIKQHNTRFKLAVSSPKCAAGKP